MELRRYDYLIQRLLSTLLLSDFKAYKSDVVPKLGDLVMLQSAPQSEWHLSYFVEDCPDGYHLLESVKTGELMRWGNVGLLVLNEEVIGAGEPARWNDAQFDFRDKFVKVSRKADFYISIPFIAGFEGDKVKITFRTRFSFDDVLTLIEPFHWPKITQKKLLSILLAGEAAHKNRRLAAKEQKEPTND